MISRRKHRKFFEVIYACFCRDHVKVNGQINDFSQTVQATNSEA